ncbi:SCO0607 family lipoprotein [Streptomyces sp. NBC_01236]|uniref:SCO0607 family lipoprotein n=1 Tax=Streptomyces sp. NBC_01236 TaxID=2903789 RepID=UPI003FA3C03F
MPRDPPGTAAVERHGPKLRLGWSNTAGLVAAAFASAAAVVALSGCSSFDLKEDICSSGEYPVLSVGGTGSACVSDGEAPPAGFVRYPAGKVPGRSTTSGTCTGIPTHSTKTARSSTHRTQADRTAWASGGIPAGARNAQR